MRFRFPFRRDNRRPDGSWDVPDATDDNIKGTSVDPYDPVWPRWKQAPPDHGEGEFISEEPFFDIDEISQKAEFYPPGRPLVDSNVNGNPASRQRVGDMPSGNLWRRRLHVPRRDEATELIRPMAFAQQTTPTAPNSLGQPMPNAKSTQSDVMQSIKPIDIPGRMSGRVLGRKYELGVPSEKGGVFIQVVEGLEGTMYFRGRGRRNVASGDPYVEILGEVGPGQTGTRNTFDDQYTRDPRDRTTISGNMNGRGRVYFLEGVTSQQLQREGFNPSDRTGLSTGGKMSRPGGYEVPAGTPEVFVPFNITW
jgi:hypothetical protein